MVPCLAKKSLPWNSKEKKKGIFNLFSKEVRKAIITVAIEDAPVARATNRADHKILEQANLDKEELMVKKSLDKSKKSLVKGTMYKEIYNSEAFWKGDSKIVKANLKNLDSESKKREALTENIRIRAKRFG